MEEARNGAMASSPNPIQILSRRLRDCLRVDQIDEFSVLEVIHELSSRMPAVQDIAHQEIRDELVVIQTGLCARILARNVEGEMYQVCMPKSCVSALFSEVDQLALLPYFL